MVITILWTVDDHKPYLAGSRRLDQQHAKFKRLLTFNLSIDSLQYTQTATIRQRSLTNRDIGSPMWRVDINCEESFDSTISSTPFRGHLRNIFWVSCKSTSGTTGRHQLWRVVRFDNISNPLSWPLVEYFLSVLQIDFRCAFPCSERWFIRFSV